MDIPLVTIKDFKTKKGLNTSHIVAFSDGMLLHCYDHTDESILDKCKNYYTRTPSNTPDYKIYKNIFK